ncbi:site-2 protease family protein [Streptomyces sp. NPDC021562]|uniref:site-2 protease family protein n=1 Tax=Streptomyces sp. NPDC021562 TaxID=3155121 RepID=UPI0033DEB9C5
MDVSGGSGQPRSDDAEPAEHPAGPTAPTDDGGPAPTDAPTIPTGAEPPAVRPASDSADERGDDSADGREHGSAEGAPRPATEPPAADTAEPAPAARASVGPEAPESDPAPTARPAPTSVGPEAPESGSATTARPAPASAIRADSPGGDPGHTARQGGEHRGGKSDDESDERSHAHSGPAAQGQPPKRPKEPGGGLLMGRPFGVPVYVAPSWFLVAALITWVFGGQLDRVLPELGAARYLVSLFFAVAFYASVLIHELAHTVAAIRFKLPVRRIQLQFFGGVSEIEKEAETPGREFVLAFVGPLLSLVLAGVFYLAMQPVEPGTVPGVLLAGLMVSNLIVAAFNLLPGLPLDGGRMLRAVVWKITGRPMSGTVAAAWVGRALAVSVLIGLPLLNYFGAFGGGGEDTGGMDSLTDALLAAILAAIIWTGAGNSLRMARLREHLPELRARTLTRRAVPVETDTPLSEALRRANAAGARALVVVDADGTPLSLVREAAIVGVPEHRRPWVAVSGVAQELTDGMRVSAELAGEDLLDVLRATPATEYLVVEETGEIYGVLSAADVERAFVKAMARPS